MTPHPSPASAARDCAARVADQLFGGFTLGCLHLALPMSALREVTSLHGLSALPCPCPAVLGGINLRGVLVPVLDLRAVFGLPMPDLPARMVVVTVHQGRILGLLADGVSGVFDTHDRAPSAVTAHDPMAAIFCATVRRADTDVAVNILSPQALADLPQVPWVDDPEPSRQPRATSSTDDVPAAEVLRPVMVLQCGRVPLAIDALSVHSTLSAPRINPSVLAGGACEGSIEHGGQHIAALDLLAVTGLGRRDAGMPPQALLMRGDDGLVALLVDAVIDIVGCKPDAVAPVPPFVLPRPELFEGALPASQLPADVATRAPQGVDQFLVLSPKGLVDSVELHGAMRTNTAASPDGRAPRAAAAGGSLQQHEVATGACLITFDLQGEAAVPIEQVHEILPFHQTLALFSGPGAVLGMLADRGRSIPVVCLSRLLLGQAVQATNAASVLVVQAGHHLVGFAVPALRAIEHSRWQPQSQVFNRSHNGGSPAPGAGLRTGQLAQVGTGAQERMLPVLDLVQAAWDLQQRRSA